MRGVLGDRNGREPKARVVVLSGSPVPGSRTWSLATTVGEHLEERELEVELIDLRALPPAEVLHGAGEAGAVRNALDALVRADGVVVTTPIHHASYSGLLKAFLDLLPRAGLAGKVVLPLAVGGSPAHVLAIEYALRPVLVALGATHVARGHVVVADDLQRDDDGATHLEPQAERRLDRVLGEFVLDLRRHADEEASPAHAPVS